MLNRSDTYLGGLGARMAIARNEIGLSQARMAEALGMSQRAYQSYETGKRSIPVEALVDMHRQFGVDLNWICSASRRSARAMIWRRWRGSRRRSTVT